MARVVGTRLRTSDATPWPVSVREFSVSGYAAVVLASEAEIREEWEAMRNCALEHAAGCRRGTRAVISLRDRETGERVVTVVLKREHGRYVALDARRRFDRPAGPELWLAAQRAAAIYAGAGEARVARRATAHRRATRSSWPCASGSSSGPQAAFDFGAN